MKNKILKSPISAEFEKIDWKLLIFLLLFLNFKLIIKIFALVLIYLLRPDFKLGFKIKDPRLPLFYIIVPAVAVLNWAIYGMAGNLNYSLVLLTGVLFWMFCILAIHQVKLAVEKNDPEVLHKTILVFFIINALISLGIYGGIVWETGAINPYRYQGNYQKYFIGTGDYIKGLTFDTSTTNAVISGLGVIYFLLRRENIPAVVSMVILLLTGSNFTNLLLCCTLLYLFFFQSHKDQKSIIVVCFALLITFLVKISPQNNRYVATAYEKIFNLKRTPEKDTKAGVPVTEKPDSILTDAERKQKFAQLYLDTINISLSKRITKQTRVATLLKNDAMARPVIPGDSIHTPSFQHRNDTNLAEKKLIQFIENNTDKMRISSHAVSTTRLPGKAIALQQTYYFLKKHPFKILTGAGLGNFSSKLAFRATCMNLSGGYPLRFAYINEDFKANHLDLFLFYFTDKDDYHSVMNSPNSTYDQLLSEYGLTGLISFAFFYIGFFVRQMKLRSLAVPVILFMLGAFFIEYWFEQLSVVVFFELLVLLNIKETSVAVNHVAT